MQERGRHLHAQHPGQVAEVLLHAGLLQHSCRVPAHCAPLRQLPKRRHDPRAADGAESAQSLQGAPFELDIMLVRLPAGAEASGADGPPCITDKHAKDTDNPGMQGGPESIPDTLTREIQKEKLATDNSGSVTMNVSQPPVLRRNCLRVITQHCDRL